MAVASRHIPESIKRDLLREAGHRCAVPTCRETNSLQFEHIEDWSKLEIKEHDFDKMIVLCANCHHRVTHTKDIPKSSVQAYKKNLATITGRYSLFEMRLMREFFDQKVKPITITENGMHADKGIVVSFSDQFHIKELLRSEYVMFFDMNNAEKPIKNNQPNRSFPNKAFVTLTSTGKEFCEKYFTGEPIK